jgi:hypothetical protein
VRRVVATVLAALALAAAAPSALAQAADPYPVETIGPVDPIETGSPGGPVDPVETGGPTGPVEPVEDCLQKVADHYLAHTDAYRLGLNRQTVKAEPNKPPGPTKPHPPLMQVTCQGANMTIKNSSVGGGDVTVAIGVSGKPTTEDRPVRNDGFSLSYQGKDSSTTRWLQFIWREVIAIVPDKDGKEVAIPVEVKFGDAKDFYLSTFDPTKPVYNTDSSKGSPYYESDGYNNRDDKSTTIYDYPSGAGPTTLKKCFVDLGAVRVITRAHFVSYLVRDDKVLYRVQIDMEWVYTSANANPRPTFTVSGDVVDKLDPAIRKKLLEQHPAHDYLP